jgi:uncharacterized protein YbaR (Trm112 family)
VTPRTHESPAALTYGAPMHTTATATRSRLQRSTGPRAAAQRRVVGVAAPRYACPACAGRLLRDPWPLGAACTWSCLNCSREFRIVDGVPVLFAHTPTEADARDRGRRPHTGMVFHGLGSWEEDTEETG